MALEDAVLLAEMLSRDVDVETTLRAFGETRYSLCKFVQNTSRKVGEAGAQEDAAMVCKCAFRAGRAKAPAKPALLVIRQQRQRSVRLPPGGPRLGEPAAWRIRPARSRRRLR